MYQISVQIAILRKIEKIYFNRKVISIIHIYVENMS
jgi:hypothetical protein